MNRKALRIDFVGDVLTRPFVGIKGLLSDFDVTLQHYDIDQHIQVLLSETTPDVLICHARIEHFLVDDDFEQAAEQMQAYCAALSRFVAAGSTLIIVNTLLVPINRVVGVAHIARARIVAQMNAMLFDCVDQHALISIADIASIMTAIGFERGYNQQNDMVMRMPYTHHAIKPIITEYGRCIRERFAARKKVVLVDADNTLWGGIVGEDGVDGIVIDESFPGVVYRKFQMQLRALRSSGILIGLLTKNNEADVQEAFSKHDMPLKWSGFSVIRANWQPKSENIAAIAQELNVGVDSLVFIDDNQFELDEVGHALPMVESYRFDGRNPQEALTLLSRIRDLSAWAVTSEDQAKATQYSEEGDRKALQAAVGSIEDYIKSLEIRIEVGLNRVAEVKRIAQLTNKTNQFNLTTRRYGESDIIRLMGNARVYDFRVTDRFGDMGVVGIIIIVDREIDTFLMSCRALGRKIEGHMLKYVCDAAIDGPLISTYIATAKNAMVANFYDDNGFALQNMGSGRKSYGDYIPCKHDRTMA